jgi:hypothetical protein
LHANKKFAIEFFWQKISIDFVPEQKFLLLECLPYLTQIPSLSDYVHSLSLRALKTSGLGRQFLLQINAVNGNF